MKYVLAFLLLGSATTDARSQNLIVNGDFENGMKGWTTSWPGVPHGVRSAEMRPGTYSNAFYAQFNSNGGGCVIDGTPFSGTPYSHELSMSCMWLQTGSQPPPMFSSFINVDIVDANTNAVVAYAGAFGPSGSLYGKAWGSARSRVWLSGQGKYFPKITITCGLLHSHLAHVDDVELVPVRASVVGARFPSPWKSMCLTLASVRDPNQFYVLGSSFGTGPIGVGKRQVGLSPDGLLFLSAGNQLPGWLLNYHGHLDSAGAATAYIHVPNDNRLVGLSIHSAFVTLDRSAPFGIGTISSTYSFLVW